MLCPMMSHGIYLLVFHITGFRFYVANVCVFYRADCEHVDNVVDPFDWTFTTDYCGTLLGHDGNSLQVCHLHQTVALKVVYNDFFGC